MQAVLQISHLKSSVEMIWREWISLYVNRFNNDCRWGI